jgi:hypothetical protein
MERPRETGAFSILKFFKIQVFTLVSFDIILILADDQKRVQFILNPLFNIPTLFTLKLFGGITFG